MAYFERRPVYESSVGRSLRLYEVIPKEVTLRQEPRFYWHLIPAWPNTLPVHWTVFEEVSIVEPEGTWSAEVKAFILQGIKRERVPLEKFALVVFRAMREAVERAWKPEKFHFVLHSAGWDSRLISLAIRSLYRERGEGWLGDVLFVECANEAREFKQVMRLEGWQEPQYMVYNEGASPEEYHARSLSFATAWERMDGGMRPYPFNMWWDTVEWAQEQGLVSEDIQCWSGFTANWVTRIGGGEEGSLGEALAKIPRNALSAVPLKAEWVFPYADLDFMRAMLGVESGLPPPRTMEQAVIYLMPEMARIRNPVDVRYRALSDRLYARAIADYRASWYGRGPGQAARPVQTIDYDRWWGHWGLASLCERLLAEGHRIR